MTDPQTLDRLREHWNRQPEPPNEAEHLDMFDEKRVIPEKPPPWCERYRHRQGWRSIYGHVVCAVCHPPVSDSVVAEWIEESE